jgi:hypothetical protein
MAKQARRTKRVDPGATRGFTPILTVGVAGLAGIIVLVMISAHFSPARIDQDSSRSEARTTILQLVSDWDVAQQYQATATADELLFIDDLSSNVNGWDLNSIQSRWLDWSFTGVKLRVARTAAVVPFAGLMRYCLPVPKRAFADFQFSLDARSKSRAAGIGYGICVDRSSYGIRYYFALDSDGVYSVFVEEQPPAPQPEFIQEPTALSSVNIADTNRISVSAVGSTLAFYVNDVEVTKVTNVPSGLDSVGLFVEVVPGSGDETWVEFSRLLIRRP